MGQLDPLISKLVNGHELLLETNKEPSLRTQDGLKSVSPKPLTSPQILTLLNEFAPADRKDDLKQGKNTSFNYLLGGNHYKVTFMQHADVVRAIVAVAEKPDAPPQSKDGAPKEASNASGTAAAVSPLAPAKTASGPPEIDRFFKKMLEMKSSDLHLTSTHVPMVRASGDMIDMPGEPAITPEKMKELLYAIMPQYNITQFEENNDTDFPYEIQGLSRFRANVFRDRFGIGGVFRQIPAEIITAEILGLSKEVLDLCYLSKGLVLVTGPTGSGKSTTLCALIDYINRNRKLHIITIEDPIEFVHPKKQCLLNQREVHVHTNSFKSALKAALREDPDIMLVGEMRDLETIAIAIETAETGHLVFGTLHTSTAASTVDRIIDQFPADRQAQIRTMLASSLKGVIAQTLCKKTGGGRIAAQEILFVTSAVSNLIRDGKIFQIPSVVQTSRAQGMVLLNDALFDLVIAKKIAPEEAYIKSIDKTGLLAQFKTKNIKLQLQEQKMLE